MLHSLSEYIAAFFIKKGIKKAVKDTIITCLNANIGLGCAYYTVLPKEGNVEVQVLGIATEYFVIINHDILRYYIVKDKLIIFQGDFRREQNPADVALDDFATFRNLTRAIEGAALGMWEWFDSYVDHNWESIMDDITRKDVQGAIIAHELRLRINA